MLPDNQSIKNKSRKKKSFSKRTFFVCAIIGVMVGILTYLKSCLDKENSVNYNLNHSNNNIINQNGNIIISNTPLRSIEAPCKFERNEVVNKIPRTDIAVIIVDRDRKPLYSLSDSISSLYIQKGYSVSTNLFTQTFLESKCFTDLKNGNSELINKLELSSCVKYIVIGQYSSTFRSVPDTITCDGTLDISKISCIDSRQIDAFSITRPAGQFSTLDTSGAQQADYEKIIDFYRAIYKPFPS